MSAYPKLISKILNDKTRRQSYTDLFSAFFFKQAAVDSNDLIWQLLIEKKKSLEAVSTEPEIPLSSPIESPPVDAGLSLSSSSILERWEYYPTTNNALHNAILQGDIAACFRLIDLHRFDAAFLNTQSLNNTPLMLAMKCGLFSVAKHLITTGEVDCTLSDARGFSVLHFACAFRAHEIIDLLLEVGAISPQAMHQQLIHSEWFKGYLSGQLGNREKISQRITPLALYEHAWHADCLSLSDSDISDHSRFRAPIANPLLNTRALIFTDLLFHMHHIGINLNLFSKQDFERQLKKQCFDEGPVDQNANQETVRHVWIGSSSVFCRLCAQTVMTVLCEARNSITPELAVLEALCLETHEDCSLSDPSLRLK